MVMCFSSIALFFTRDVSLEANCRPLPKSLILGRSLQKFTLKTFLFRKSMLPSSPSLVSILRLNLAHHSRLPTEMQTNHIGSLCVYYF
jgi:hypothetical protein